MGMPFFAKLSQIPAAQRVDDEARGLALGWYVSRHDEDRHDESTTWHVALFDVPTGEELTFLATSVHERNDTGEVDGVPLHSAAFDPASESGVLLRFEDGAEHRAELVREPPPPSEDVVMSGAEQRVQARMAADAAKLRARLKRSR